MNNEMRKVIQDAIRVVAESADEIKAGCEIGDDWPDAEDKAEYDWRVSVLESLKALLTPSAPAVDGARDYLPMMPSNVTHVMRRIRRCESEGAAQVVLEHFATEYAYAALSANPLTLPFRASSNPHKGGTAAYLATEHYNEGWNACLDALSAKDEPNA